MNFLADESCAGPVVRALREAGHDVIAIAEVASGATDQRDATSENTMKKKTEKREQSDELRREYNLKQLKGGVRGKYAARYRAGTNLVLLSPDVAEYFPDEQSVNKALRGLIQAGNGPLRRTR